jgi:hypothetical protein
VSVVDGRVNDVIFFVVELGGSLGGLLVAYDLVYETEED